eukprot:3932608-Ditylum_brightwellii.AAC.1
MKASQRAHGSTPKMFSTGVGFDSIMCLWVKDVLCLDHSKLLPVPMWFLRHRNITYHIGTMK